MSQADLDWSSGHLCMPGGSLRPEVRDREALLPRWVLGQALSSQSLQKGLHHVPVLLFECSCSARSSSFPCQRRHGQDYQIKYF